MEKHPLDGAGSALTPTSPSLRVLLVDDERESRAVLTAFLSLEGVQVVAVATAEEALMRLHDRPFDLVIADLGLPGASGFDLLRQVRRSGAPWAQLPIVAVTGRASAIDREVVLEAGFQGHVAKPVDLQGLLVAIRTATGSVGSRMGWGLVEEARA